MQEMQPATVRDVPVPNVASREYSDEERRTDAEAVECSEACWARSKTPAMMIRVHHPHPLKRHLLAKGYTRPISPARHCERETAKAGQVQTLRDQRLTHDTGVSVNGSRKRRSDLKADAFSCFFKKGTRTGGGSVSSRHSAHFFDTVTVPMPTICLAGGAAGRAFVFALRSQFVAWQINMAETSGPSAFGSSFSSASRWRSKFSRFSKTAAAEFSTRLRITGPFEAPSLNSISFRTQSLMAAIPRPSAVSVQYPRAPIATAAKTRIVDFMLHHLARVRVQGTALERRCQTERAT